MSFSQGWDAGFKTMLIYVGTVFFWLIFLERYFSNLGLSVLLMNVTGIVLGLGFFFWRRKFCRAKRAAAEAEPDIGLIIYNTFWTSAAVSFSLVERLTAIPNLVGLKWACPRTDAMEFEDVVATFAPRLTIIDNHLMFAQSAMLGATAFEVHLCNYWPEWGTRLIRNVKAGKWQDIQLALVREAMPFYKLWVEIEKTYTSGDGSLDKLCMELVGLPSSRCRPPTRDIREGYRERCRQMMIATGVPGVLPG